MSIPAVASNRRIAFIMLFIGLVGAGIFGYTQLGLSLTPDISFPMVTVSCEMTGASPEEMDNLVTDVLEKAVSGVAGVQEINSTSTTGLSMVTVEFDYGDDMDDAETDVRRKIEDYTGLLPDDAGDPTVSVMDPSSMPVVTMSITSDELDGEALRKLIEDDVDPIFNRAEGVGATTISGGSIRQVRIEPDMARLADSGIGLAQIAAAFAGRTSDVPAGELSGNGIRTGLTFEMAYASVEEISETVVGFRNGNAVLLSHVAEVYDGREEVTQLVRVNGDEGIILSVVKRSEANTVDVCEAVKEAIEEVEGIYGDRLEVTLVTDQSDYIMESINNLSTTGVIAFLAAIAVLFFFLRSGKTSSLAGISIPVSLVITFFAMYAFDVDLNMVSLAGLAIAVGMLVDSGIVVIESIHRYRGMGKSAMDAAVQGTEEVAGAITSSTLTTLMVFIPVLFVPGFTGQLFREMALTICFSLVASLLVSISLIPAISTFFRDMGGEKKIGPLDRIGSGAVSLLRRVLDFALSHRKGTLFGVLGLFILSLFFLGTIPVTMMPDMDQGEIKLNYTLARGTDLAANDSIAAVIEGEIREIIPEEYIESFYVKVGAETSRRGATAINEGSIRATLVGVSERDTETSEYSFRILRAVNGLPGVDVSISQRGPFSTGNPVEILLSGDDIEELEVFSAQLVELLEGVPGTNSVTSSAEQRIPQYFFTPDNTVLSLLGISPVDVSTQMQIGFQGRTVASYTEEGEDYDVFLRYPPESRRESDDVRYSQFAGYPMEALGDLNPGSSMEQITRKDQTRTVTVSSGTAPGYTSGQVGSAVEEAVASIAIPSGVAVSFGGDYGDQDETFLYMALAIAIAAILVYMVMAGQFESLREPFIIIFTVPMAFIGVIAALVITGVPMSLMSMVGILMLAGISVNNGIVLVDYANKLRDKGKNCRDAIVEAVSVRTRPIMMTALTTIFAMVPVAMGIGDGSEMWQPLGVTVIGGLVTTTLLTLIVEPCLYLMAAKK